jgi:hypothetical protein
MVWTGGYRGADVATITGAVFIGSEAGGFLRYMLDTGQNIPQALTHKGIYAARLDITSIGMTGGTPGAGNYMADIEFSVSCVFSQPFFQAGAGANYASDPFTRGGPFCRLRLLIRMRPLWVPDATTSLAVISANWQVYRIT